MNKLYLFCWEITVHKTSSKCTVIRNIKTEIKQVCPSFHVPSQPAHTSVITFVHTYNMCANQS